MGVITSLLVNPIAYNLSLAPISSPLSFLLCAYMYVFYSVNKMSHKYSILFGISKHRDNRENKDTNCIYYDLEKHGAQCLNIYVSSECMYGCKDICKQQSLREISRVKFLETTAYFSKLLTKHNT